MMFVKMRRLELIVDRPKIKQEEITTLCGTQWRQLDEETKGKFKELADKHNEAKRAGIDPQTGASLSKAEDLETSQHVIMQNVAL